jgi:hypothetical protein
MHKEEAVRGAILLPLDGSNLVALTLPLAAYLGHSRDARLLLIRVPVDINETNAPNGELFIKNNSQDVMD